MSNPPPSYPPAKLKRVFFLSLDGNGHIGDLIDNRWFNLSHDHAWAIVQESNGHIWTVHSDRIICDMDDLEH